VTGHSVGIVLSGGGARGIAHIGALQAFVDAGVTIDRVGGTSMGALVGALFASGRSPSELAATLRRELVDRRPFADYAIPRNALIRARRARSMLERLFGATAIEELARTFFCLSADLVAAESVVHRRGPLAIAVGASMSLPGIAPPIPDGDRLLVDGGVLDNLPIEVMLATDDGPVIAIDVLARGVPGARRSPRSARGPQLPSIVETLARSSTLASRRRADRQRALANLVIAPDLNDVGLLDFARFDEIIDAGRRATVEALASTEPEMLALLRT
jgi:predicted acylesterase/phospholipase RssA